MREIPLTGGGRTAVSRKGDVVLREAGPWTPAVHEVLRHLERAGFPAAPRVVGSGFDDRGRETVSWLEGEIVLPHTWGEGAMRRLGRMIRELHEALRSFEAPEDAVWRAWHGRALGQSSAGFGHCDLGPWNVVSQAGQPRSFIDWEVAGPVDPIYDLAQACWLNAQLYDDEVAARTGLPDVHVRAGHARQILDGYELPGTERTGFTDRMIEFALHDAEAQADGVTIEPETHAMGNLWGVVWRVRSAAWMLRHRQTLDRAFA